MMELSFIIALMGGLALFLYGMKMMSDGLELCAGDRLQSILERLTSNRLMGVIVGALITALIQSSSATTDVYKRQWACLRSGLRKRIRLKLPAVRLRVFD